MNLPPEYLCDRFEMIKRLEESSMKVKYTITKQELEEMIIENLSTEHEINDIDFVCLFDNNHIPYLERVEINCEK
jgi:hypothetical protein